LSCFVLFFPVKSLYCHRKGLAHKLL
jgi:hypothetical protein